MPVSPASEIASAAIAKQNVILTMRITITNWLCDYCLRLVIEKGDQTLNPLAPTTLIYEALKLN